MIDQVEVKIDVVTCVPVSVTVRPHRDDDGEYTGDYEVVSFEPPMYNWLSEDELFNTTDREMDKANLEAVEAAIKKERGGDTA